MNMRTYENDYEEYQPHIPHSQIEVIWFKDGLFNTMYIDNIATENT